MSKSIALLALLLVLALTAGVLGCSSEKEAPLPTPAASPTLTPTPIPTPAPTPEPVTRVFNITHTLSGLNITLVMATWVGDEVEVQWRIDNFIGQSFKASRLYSLFQPGAYATDQAGNEAEYFIPPRIIKDLEAGDPLTYKTTLLFHPESTRITIRLPDVWVEGSTFVDTAVEFSFPR